MFYVDPPYHGHEQDYGKGMFTRAEFEELAELLGTLKGSFILSINDPPEIRKTFAAFRTLEVKTRYSAVKQVEKRRQVTELLITSPLPAAG